MNLTAIIDYKMGNLDSVKRAVEECGGKAIITNNSTDIEIAARIILPGVGAFPTGMENLINLNLLDVIKEQALEKKIPFLGICLGMQLIATKGFEFNETEGLNLIAGEVIKLQSHNGERIPHIGWNEIHFIQNSKLLDGIINGTDFYFVHSYHFVCENEKNIIAKTPYCGEFNSIIGKDNIWGTQFHPEKSQKYGFKLLKNFLNM